jgi:hypothetical protein
VAATVCQGEVQKIDGVVLLAGGFAAMPAHDLGRKQRPESRSQYELC